MKKKSKQNILITCAGGSGPIYLANKLKGKYGVILADGGRHNAGPYLGLPFYEIPFGNDPRYIGVIAKICKKHSIDCIVPGADEELLPLSRFDSEHPKIKTIIPSSDFIETCLDKKQLMGKLSQLNISDLSYFKSINEVKYPAIAKPIFGRGSREVHIVKSRGELEGYLVLYGKKFDEVLVQPQVIGDEYTVSVIVNNLNKLIGVVPKKVLCKRGITRAAVTKKAGVIDRLCKEIVNKLEPKGPFNVQLILKDGKVRIFEINPRLSTTSVLTDAAFGNEVELFLKNYDKEEIPKNKKMKENVRLFRYEENLIK